MSSDKWEHLSEIPADIIAGTDTPRPSSSTSHRQPPAPRSSSSHRYRGAPPSSHPQIVAPPSSSSHRRLGAPRSSSSHLHRGAPPPSSSSHPPRGGSKSQPPPPSLSNLSSLPSLPPATRRDPPPTFRQGFASRANPKSHRAKRAKRNNNSRHKPAISSYDRNQIRADAFHEPAPAANRSPELLYNKHCGAKWIEGGRASASDLHFFHQLIHCEQWTALTVYSNIYHFRNNIIKNKEHLPPSGIQGIFRTQLVEFKCPVFEFIKRYSMRIKALNGHNPNDIYWAGLETRDINKLIDFLKSLGNCRGFPPLFIFGCDDRGNHYIQINPSELTLAYFQTINSIHDILSLFRNIKGIEHWIAFTRWSEQFSLC